MRARRDFNYNMHYHTDARSADEFNSKAAMTRAPRARSLPRPRRYPRDCVSVMTSFFDCLRQPIHDETYFFAATDVPRFAH